MTSCNHFTFHLIFEAFQDSQSLGTQLVCATKYEPFVPNSAQHFPTVLTLC